MEFPNLNNHLERYRVAIEHIHQGKVNELTLTDRLEPLLARDAIQLACADDARPTAQELEQILQLDRQLQNLANCIFCDADVYACRDQVRPGDSAWWWFLEVQQPSPPAYLTTLDGLWKLGAAACLALAATFMTQTVQAFSTQGFDVLGTMGAIAQGAGLAIVAQGTLTDNGKDRLHDTLRDLGIPTHLHEEVTFALAVSALLASYGFHSNLYRFSDYYHHLGQRQEADKQWSDAKKSYARALDFSEQNDAALLSLGRLTEELGEYEEAAQIYHQGILSGDPQFYNALGRSRLRRGLEANGWQGRLDRAVLSDALSLFNRAKQASEIGYQSNSEMTIDQLALETDIQINLGIAQWASVDLNLMRRNPEDDRSLFVANNWFSEAHKVETQLINRWEQQQLETWKQALQNDQKNQKNQSQTPTKETQSILQEKLLTAVIPWHLLRSQCFQATAEAILVASKASRKAFTGALYIEGLDPRLVNDNVGFSCHELLQATGDVQASNDAMLLSSLLTSQRVMSLNSMSDNGFQALKSLDPGIADRHAEILKQKLENYIKTNQLVGTTRMPLVNRVLVDANNNIVGIYAYDYFSILNFSKTPPYLLAQTQTRDTLGEPIADFWVQFRSLERIEVQPWYRRYAVDRVTSASTQKPPFKVAPLTETSPPNFSELAILRALAYVQLRNQMIALRSDSNSWTPSFERKLIYNVFVAADGRIVGYAPAPYNNNEAEQKIRSTPLRSFPQDDKENQAVAYFLLTFKSSDAFQLDAGTSITNPVLWKIPKRSDPQE
jgi:tetratricopeptide (TPR) repeat protein